MSYALVQEFVDGFGFRETNMVADRNQDGDYEAAVVQAALDDATQQINYAVGQKCPLPLPDSTSDEVRGMLRRWCLDIARYRLTGASGVVVTDDISDRYKEARADLDKVVAGKLLICRLGTTASDGSTGLNADDGSAGQAESESAGRIFTVGQNSGFMGRLA